MSQHTLVLEVLDFLPRWVFAVAAIWSLERPDAGGLVHNSLPILDVVHPPRVIIGAHS